MVLSETQQMAKAEDVIKRGGDPLPILEDIIRSSGVSRNILIKRLKDHGPTFRRFREDDGVELLQRYVRRILDYLIWLGED